MKDAMSRKIGAKVLVNEVSCVVGPETLDLPAKLRLNHRAELTDRCGHRGLSGKQIGPGVTGGFVNKDKKPAVPFEARLWCWAPNITVNTVEWHGSMRLRRREWRTAVFGQLTSIANNCFKVHTRTQRRKQSSQETKRGMSKSLMSELEAAHPLRSNYVETSRHRTP